MGGGGGQFLHMYQSRGKEIDGQHDTQSARVGILHFQKMLANYADRVPNNANVIYILILWLGKTYKAVFFSGDALTLVHMLFTNMKSFFSHICIYMTNIVLVRT